MRQHADLAMLKRTHPLAAMAASYGVALRSSGQALLGCCPFHEDHEPSLLVDPRDDHFHCFGCRAHGDVLDFIQRMERLDFRGALERLAHAPPPRAITATVAVGRPNAAPGRRRGPTVNGPAERACLAAATELYQRQLLTEPRALAYAASRGLTQASLARFRLGYASGDGLLAELRRRGLPVAAARQVGLLNRVGREHLAGRLVVPEVRAGQPIWLIGRAIAPDHRFRRYLGLPGPKPLLGWEEAAGAATVFLTEGPFDWLALRQWGYPALALVGTHVRLDVLRSLDRFARLALVLDNDEAGRAATGVLARALGHRAECVALPPGVKDVAELALRRDGNAEFARAVRHVALPRAA